MNKTTRIRMEDTRDFDFYTVLIQCKSQEAIRSLESFLVDKGLESERCGSDGFESFSSPKIEWDNKAHFENSVRKMVVEWKANKE